MRRSNSKVPAPGYTTDKPRYPSLIRLNAELGFQDAALQVSELAMQILREQAAVYALGSSAYLSDEFSRRCIPHGTSDLNTAQRVIHDAAIVQTHAVIDGVLRQLAREYQMHKWISGFSWTDGLGNVKSPLEVLLTHLPPSGEYRLRQAPECSLIEYYRLLRVSIVHRTDKASKAAHAAFNLLSPQLSYFSKTYELAAPNKPDAVDFQDFRLFTRSIKYFANLLNDECDLKLHDICHFLVHKDREIVSELLPVSKAKQFGALRAYTHMRYGLDPKDVKKTLSQGDLSSLRKRIEVTNALNAYNRRSKPVLRMDPSRSGTFIFTEIVKKGSDEIQPPSGPFDAEQALAFLAPKKPQPKPKRKS